MPKSTTTHIHVRVNPEVKAKAEKIYSDYGLTLTNAINIFLYQSCKIKGLPFDLRESDPNKETLEAMEEVERKINGETPAKQQSVSSLFKELDIDVEC